MNKVNLIGRLTKDVEARYSQGENPLCVARYTIAVDRKFKKEGEASADFITCVAFGKSGEFAEKYLKKGMKIAVSGRIQTGSYTDKETGKKVYTTDIVVEEHYFCESKSGDDTQDNRPPASETDFMDIPAGIQEELPFA